MNPAALAMLVKALKKVVDEHGFERSRSDANWLNNILGDYSPQTSALNRVVATVAREGFPDLLRRATTVGESDAVVGQAVSRLVSAHAIEQGAAYAAVTAWATVLGVMYTKERPSSVMSASSLLGVGGRLERKIQRLLDEAEAAEGSGDWAQAVERYDEVLTLDPAHFDALQLRGLAERRKAKNSPEIPSKQAPVPKRAPVAKQAPVASPLSGWRTAVMVDCGEDSFGRSASVVIAGVKVTFRYCAPGRFLMGSPESEVGRFDDEGPAHEVELTQGFWMAEVPVTQRLWEAVARSNPSRFKGADQPVEKVSWFDCDGWMGKANSVTGGLNLRFPTEAEWEYAARAGTTGPRYGGLDLIAWHDANSGKQTHPVRQKIANAWGLYDMLGNVWEWCSDGHMGYQSGRVTDPIGPRWGSSRVSRGGGWNEDAGDVRFAYRRGVDPSLRYRNLGLRPVLSSVR